VLIGATPVTIGRDPASDLVLSDSRVSWRHARLTLLPDGRTILEDLGSSNGTSVNGTRVTDRTFLNGGEIVSLGGVELAFSVAPRAAPPPPDQFVAPYPGPSSPSPSMIQRVTLQRSVRRANILAAIAVATSAVVVVVVVAVGLRGGEPTVTTPPATAVPVTPGPATIADTAAQAEASTVLVVAQVNGQRNASGSGWVWDAANGLIVTNQHVINDGETFQIGVDTMTSAEVVAGAPCEDLAVLRVSGVAGLRTLPLGSQTDTRRGDTVIALGYPLNASPTDDLQVTVGDVSAVKITYDPGAAFDVPAYPNVLQTTAAINPGNSGGPLLNISGQLVGVNSAKPPVPVEQTNYAIGVDRVKEIVPTLAGGKSMLWTGLGFTYVTAAQLQSNDRLGQALVTVGLPAKAGLYIYFAAAGGGPQQLQLPALIVTVNGKPMDGTLQSYCDAVSSVSTQSVRVSAYTAGVSEPIDADLAFR